jgi:transposase
MELEEALREIERLKAENESLRAELYAERAEKEKALLALLHEREKRKIAYARQFLPKTEKSSAVVINEAEEIIAEAAKKAPEGPRRRKFEGIDFERYVTETRVLKPDLLACPECGRTLVKIGEKARYQIEADPINVRVIKLVKETYKCPGCNKRSGRVYCPTSEEAFPGTPLTPSMAAYLAYHKYELGVPFHHLERHFSNTLGIPLSKQTMAGWMAMAAERLGPVYERMKADLLATPTKVIHADETTLTLSKRADPSRRKSYVFVYASSFYDERQIHVYEFSETREIDPGSSFLRDFGGWVECDDYAGYDRLRKGRPNVRLQRCWAHARRKFADIVKGLPQKARPKSVAFAVMSEMDSLFEIERKAHEDRLFGRDLLDVREREERPIIGRIRALVFGTEAKKGSALEGALGYVKKIWDDLLPYLSEPYLELSNNLAERCVKPFVVARKVFQASGSEAGARYTVTLFSVIRTAIINGLDPYRYLEYALENVGRKPVEDILPYSKNLKID